MDEKALDESLKAAGGSVPAAPGTPGPDTPADYLVAPVKEAGPPAAGGGAVARHLRVD